MNDVVLVHIRDGLNQVVDDLLRLSLGVRVLLDDSLEELATLHELGHELVIFLVVVHSEELHHEIAVELLEDGNLLLQPLLILFRQTCLLDDLDRVQLAVGLLAPEIHGREGARAQPLALLEITAHEAVLFEVALAAMRFGHSSAHLVRGGVPADQSCQRFRRAARKR